ncbi:MAG: tRNA (N6-threonylcarbamoyladenosine(37)-N6)-methyltransferase TrmO [Proteobacteria bacterium]|nr:tRNA (N6-threonylcarbamoyladenosine(37)-N6)-methyltransferase TrmO [Pseudomonadota bacterium]
MTQPFDWDAPRPGEVLGMLPQTADAGLYFIGQIRTPYARREDCPHQGDFDGPECRIEVLAAYQPALLGLEKRAYVQVLYFMHKARRDILVQTKRGSGEAFGTFALRSPVRPNPIASSIVKLERIEGATLIVRGLDCLDGTPLIDLKPWRGPI